MPISCHPGVASDAIVLQSLIDTTRVLMDASGASMNKNYAKASELLEEITTNACQWSSVKDTKKKTVSIQEVEALSFITSKLDALLSLETANVIRDSGEKYADDVEIANFVDNGSNLY
ncbi:hypothetical protein L6164_002845 [Bauhinia variegata]|uniref:Uncharacterized protein n=1 Tax=Bauhinia variegata TaxID=167791 RepID=A0ACB9Q013_BAUVA|nr:hypothetical protein L6164_002845 [Bauhinia variegata]